MEHYNKYLMIWNWIRLKIFELWVEDQTPSLLISTIIKNYKPMLYKVKIIINNDAYILQNIKSETCR